MSPMAKPASIKGAPFCDAAMLDWQPTEPGVRRKVLSHGDGIMLVHVDFEKGAVGGLHRHPHLQCSLVESGVFDVTIDGRTQRLQAGDTFFVASNLLHGVVAIEAGRLVDSFTPMREDFV